VSTEQPEQQGKSLLLKKNNGVPQKLGLEAISDEIN
jgi:hypothetical protein